MTPIEPNGSGRASRARRWALGIVAAALTCAAATGHAQPPSASSDRAAALFDEGRALTSAGKHEAACAKFAESQALEPRVGTLLNLAACEETRGLLLQASARWAECAKLASKTGDDRLQEALERARQLEARIPRLVVRLTGEAPPDATARLGKIEAERASIVAFDSEQRLDPGGYRLVLGASGHEERTYELVLAEAMRRQFDVELGPRLGEQPSEPLAPGPVGPTGAGAPFSGESSEGGDSPDSPWLATGLVVGITGIVSLGIGTALGLVAMSKQNAAETHCNESNFCDSEGLALRDDAIGMARGSTATFIVGGALVLGGLAMVVVGLSEDDTQEPAPSAALAVSPTGLWVTGRW